MNEANRSSYVQLQAQVETLARRIEAPDRLLPTYASSNDFARPHVEIDAHGYHYVVEERGEELSRETTQELDTLLFFVFRDVTFSMACTFEAAHRIAAQDNRRQLFAHQLQLLSALSPQWRARHERALAEVLARHPFRDLADGVQD